MALWYDRESKVDQRTGRRSLGDLVRLKALSSNESMGGCSAAT